jgi:bifunctional non-homologous end joining protein LigD
MGTLEFHAWGSRAGDMEKPDMVVFDLDPDEGMELKTVRQGVRDLRSILTELSLNAYLKTSGGKGYHVVVPVRPTVTWETVRDFAKSIVQVMEKKWPDRYTSNSRKNKRTGKIYVDWLRNTRGATSIAPYSLRARPGAAVSMPIAWEELGRIPPDGINMKAALRRLNKADPWADFFENDQQLM